MSLAHRQRYGIWTNQRDRDPKPSACYPFPTQRQNRLRHGQLGDSGNGLPRAFGGRGNSSYGPREQGSYAAEFYTTVKTAYIAMGTPE